MEVEDNFALLDAINCSVGQAFINKKPPLFVNVTYLWFKFGVVHTDLGDPWDFISLLRYTVRGIFHLDIQSEMSRIRYTRNISPQYSSVPCPVGWDFTKNNEKK